ncbi:hypothetical protein QBC35DRAFT_500441 [Podospora australis]|uniref:3-phytase n=1 Tax=Podospora australis TaxID=1536484 RepID=A0AAN7AGV5_9PEZI|nr:hypothetical protein QBC35DRAFT_500441 [Podospora australis]
MRSGSMVVEKHYKMAKPASLFSACLLCLAGTACATTVVTPLAVSVNVTLATARNNIESDWTSIYYSKKPLVLGNDGGAASGGIRAWDLDSAPPLQQIKHLTPGRTKLVTTVYNVGKRDLVVTIAQPDSVIRVYDLPAFVEIQSARFKVLGDWSALCAWKSQTHNQYFYLLGKRVGIQFLLRENTGKPEILKVKSFLLPFEAEGCAVSEARSVLYISGGDTKDVYSTPLSESTGASVVAKAFVAPDDVTGLTVYYGQKPEQELLLVTLENEIAVYKQTPTFRRIGSIKLEGLEDIEIQGPSIYQASSRRYPGGQLFFALESDAGAGYGLIGLKEPLARLDAKLNTNYDPRGASHSGGERICDRCSNSGYCREGSPRAPNSCECFHGFTGARCEKFTCTSNCSNHGHCAGPDTCSCNPGWGGLHCSFLVVEADHETTANGADGDDPAIWIAPGTDKSLSRIITTTKAGDTTGLGVFDLSGNLLQTIASKEPNNVDVIYDFDLGSRTVDLAFAACRQDDTLCFFEITPNGTLTTIPGGSHPVVDDFSVYGSCVYRSPTTKKQYLFVNEKSARYLQYELTADQNGTLVTTLVRKFVGGSGGQVEGCVADEDNQWIFIGEEPSALWRYPAEPDSTEAGVAIARVGDGHLHADVEGVTLVYGSSQDKGLLLVSCQGVSGYNIYRRASPHEYMGTFSIAASKDGRIDAVSNTDGITAVASALGQQYPHGLLVVHDDANELSGGGTSAEASFKLVSLEKILGAEGLAEWNLLGEVDAAWDPRG